MQVEVNDIVVFGALALASGRIAYSFVHDEIFRGARESIWMQFPPADGVLVERGDDGDVTRPARMYHPRFINGSAEIVRNRVELRIYDFRPTEPLRDPHFIGQLIECVYCLTFWTSLLAIIAWAILGDAVIYPALPFALWALSNSFSVKGL